MGKQQRADRDPRFLVLDFVSEVIKVIFHERQQNDVLFSELDLPYGKVWIALNITSFTPTEAHNISHLD